MEKKDNKTQLAKEMGVEREEIDLKIKKRINTRNHFTHILKLIWDMSADTIRLKN